MTVRFRLFFKRAHDLRVQEHKPHVSEDAVSEGEDGVIPEEAGSVGRTGHCLQRGHLQ